MKEDIKETETYKKMMEIMESGVLKYIQRTMEEIGQPVNEKEARNVFSHICREFIRKSL